MTQTTQIRDLGQIPQYPHPYHTPESYQAYQDAQVPKYLHTTYAADVAQRFRTNQSVGYYLVSPFPLNIQEPLPTQVELRDLGRFWRSAHLRDRRAEGKAGLLGRKGRNA